MRNLPGKLGWAGALGIVLLLFCPVFFFGHLLPLQDELGRVGRAREILAGAIPATPERPPLPLPGAAEQLKQLNALALRHGILIERATYRMADRGGQARLEVSMPLNLSYPVLRAYLRDVLAMPAAALEEAVLQRGQATDMAVEAQLLLSFGFARMP